MDANKKIQVLQSTFMVLILMVAVGFNLLAKTKTWNYPDYILVDTDMSVLKIYLLRNGMVAVLGIGFAVAFFAGKRGYLLERCVVSTVCTVSYLIYLFSNRKWMGYELQQLFTGSYALFCYGVAWFSKKRLGDRTGSSMYVIFGTVSMMIAQYSFLYDRFIQGRPLTSLYMAIVFILVYVMLFEKNDEKNCTKKKRYMLIFTVLAFIGLSSGGRIWDIICSRADINFGNWFVYRWNVLKAIFTNNYSDSVLDIPCKLYVQDFNILWLRHAFSASLFMGYMLVFILFVGLIWWMFRNNKMKSALEKSLIFSILATNVIGIIAEINLFWGANIGILLSQNVYQIIPVICLAFENVKSMECNSNMGKRIYNYRDSIN